MISGRGELERARAGIGDAHLQSVVDHQQTRPLLEAL
jgi:hypothetical protein